MPEKESLYERYSNYTDEQIFVILRNHKNYQSEAVDCAVKIAVERGIINSEQDLFASEYQQSKPIKMSFFPVGTDHYHQQRLFASILRFLYVISLLPIIYGFLKFGEGQLIHTIIGTSVGLAWFALCFLLKKTQKDIVILLLLLFFISVSAVIGYKIFSAGFVKTLDLVIYFIGTILPVYMLLLLKKLIKQFPGN